MMVAARLFCSERLLCCCPCAGGLLSLKACGDFEQLTGILLVMFSIAFCVSGYIRLIFLLNQFPKKCYSANVPLIAEHDQTRRH